MVGWLAVEHHHVPNSQVSGSGFSDGFVDFPVPKGVKVPKESAESASVDVHLSIVGDILLWTKSATLVLLSQRAGKRKRGGPCRNGVS